MRTPLDHPTDFLPDPFESPEDPATAVTGVAEAPVGYGPPTHEPTGAGPKPEPFYQEAEHGIRLYQGDALELLRRSRSGLFDCIFADPPYFLSNDGITCQGGKMVSVNKGMWDRAETFEAIHAFNVQWLRECRRILKPNGTIWVTGTNHNIYSVGFALQTLGYKILNDIAWYQVNPPPNLACRYFTHATETILWARRDPKARHTFHYETMKAIGDPTPGKQMQSLWRILPPGKREKRFGKHPTQKPEALLERILRASTSPGDLVLDPFCGSGTTGVAAARLGRRFVGFDLVHGYLHLATLRIQDERTTIHSYGVFCVASATDRSLDGKMETWADIVEAAMGRLSGERSLAEITAEVGRHPRAGSIRTWQCTVRRVIRQSPRFTAVSRGRYALRLADVESGEVA